MHVSYINKSLSQVAGFVNKLVYLYCDFYIPNGKVYIEYWSLYDDPKYSSRKVKKQQIYEREHHHLIELSDKELQNLIGMI